jgi:hypothetical protein
MGVIFAALGLGEAVDRFTFLDFDGATDRVPIEMLFGVGIRLDDYETGQKDLPTPNGDLRANHVDSGSQQHRAVKAITPVPYPKNQQAIRVIRKEADRIEGALTEINASAAASRSFTRRPKT